LLALREEMREGEREEPIITPGKTSGEESLVYILYVYIYTNIYVYQDIYIHVHTCTSIRICLCIKMCDNT
jgi:hypothetical protein